MGHVEWSAIVPRTAQQWAGGGTRGSARGRKRASPALPITQGPAVALAVPGVVGGLLAAYLGRAGGPAVPLVAPPGVVGGP